MIFDILALLVLLQVKHFLFDYVWQTPYQLANKGFWGHPGGILHSGLHAFGTLVVLAVLGVYPGPILAIVLVEFVVHYHLDWGKEQFVRRYVEGQGAGFWRAIGFDQLMHQLTYVAIACAVAAWGMSP